MNGFLYKQQDIDIYSARLDIIFRQEPARANALEYISKIYHENYRATITPCPDVIITHRAYSSDELLACAGISFSLSSTPFFSERYLDGSLESLILQVTKQVISRQQIVEIGALASDNPVAASELIRLMPIIAWFMGARAVLCTSTRRLRKLLSFHDIPFHVLSDASMDRLTPEEQTAWGSYYDNMPQTGVIPLVQCGHLFNCFCGRLVFSEFEQLVRSALVAQQVAA